MRHVDYFWSGYRVPKRKIIHRKPLLKKFDHKVRKYDVGIRLCQNGGSQAPYDFRNPMRIQRRVFFRAQSARLLLYPDSILWFVFFVAFLFFAGGFSAPSSSSYRLPFIASNRHSRVRWSLSLLPSSPVVAVAVEHPPGPEFIRGHCFRYRVDIDTNTMTSPVAIGTIASKLSIRLFQYE